MDYTDDRGAVAKPGGGMNYPPTALTTLEALYLHGMNICAEIDKFQPDVIIGLAHSGWRPVTVAQTLWAQTTTEDFPPAVRTNIGREKHEIYAARHGKASPAFCCSECCEGSDRLGHYLAWVAEQTTWLETLRMQIEQVYSGTPARILVIDDLFGGLRSGYTVLNLVDILYPNSKAYIFVGKKDLTKDFVTAWLEEFQPNLAVKIHEHAAANRYNHPLQDSLKPLINGTEDIAADRLDWQYLSPHSPAVTALMDVLPVETIQSAPAWAENMACRYALQRLNGELSESVPVPSTDENYFFGMRELSLTAEDRLAARAWQRNGVTRNDIVEVFGPDPAEIEKGYQAVADKHEWHQHGQGEEARYFHILALEPWITAYDLYTHRPGYIGTAPDVYGFAEFFPGQLWAGAYPMASDIKVKDQPLKDLLLAGVDTFINLIGPEDYHNKWPYRKALSQVSKETGKKVRVYSFPFPFRKGPTLREMSKIMGFITRALNAGRRIYLHAGHNLEGRTPMVLACLLIQQGCSTEQALEQVNHFWLNTLSSLICSPIADEQHRFITDIYSPLFPNTKKSKGSARQ